MRGAVNAIFSRAPEERAHGVVCHSSGNHGQAVALGARLAGARAYVVMPRDASQVKINAVRGYRAQVIFCESGDESREEACKKIAEETKAVIIPPFDDYDIIAGQATAAKEFIERIHPDCLLTPIGGGGLSAGTCLIAHYLNPKLEIYLGEPEEADDAYRSLKAGHIVPNQHVNTVADGLKTTVGAKNFAIIKEHTKEIFTVAEEEIVQAMRWIWERMKLIVEPSAAVPFAALLKNKHLFQGKKVGIILTGGNVDLFNLPF